MRNRAPPMQYLRGPRSPTPAEATRANTRPVRIGGVVDQLRRVAVITIDVDKGGGMGGRDRDATQNRQREDRQSTSRRNDCPGNACPSRHPHVSPQNQKILKCKYATQLRQNRTARKCKAIVNAAQPRIDFSCALFSTCLRRIGTGRSKGGQEERDGLTRRACSVEVP